MEFTIYDCRFQHNGIFDSVELMPLAIGEFHDQGDAEWIVIRRSLWGHNDNQPPAGLSAALGLATLRAYLVCFIYY
jgi:hypothetical protein